MYKQGGEMVSLHSPQEMPDPGEIERVEEPYLKAKILIPPDYVGAVMELTTARRGTFVTMNYLLPPRWRCCGRSRFPSLFWTTSTN